MPYTAKPIPPLTDKQKTAFYQKVSEADENGCRFWLGEKHKGYGMVNMRSTRYSAHRVSYYLYHGVIDNNLQINHCCQDSNGNRIDHPACVEPTHLYQGTAKENIRDMLNCGLHKRLNRSIAKSIREEYDLGAKRIDLKLKYNIDSSYVSNILANKSWYDETYHPNLRNDKKIPENIKTMVINEYQTTNIQRGELLAKYGLGKTSNVLCGCKRPPKPPRITYVKKDNRFWHYLIRFYFNSFSLGGLRDKFMAVQDNFKIDRLYMFDGTIGLPQYVKHYGGLYESHPCYKGNHIYLGAYTTPEEAHHIAQEYIKKIER